MTSRVSGSADPIVKEQPDDSAALVREAARRSTVAAPVAPLEPGGGVGIGQTEPRVETTQFVGKPSPVLTAAVASTDAATTRSLGACLQQIRAGGAVSKEDVCHR